ncbi:hypothetical protein ACH5RR_012709 [Cinchona calisaya]|uniref:RNase H type-1 domain-containing protein n=1 Tax=Cinchona calisaya TaxID=153742 RepID=A0ABD3AA53_9GENT
MNVDGSSRGNPGPAGIGRVIRNNSGLVFFSFSKSQVVQTNLMEKAVALLHGLQIYRDYNLSRVEIEMDSKELQWMIAGKLKFHKSWIRLFGKFKFGSNKVITPSITYTMGQILWLIG